ncbi:MAG: BamA/TamA family outer membrane protein [Candidatus Omnitrophica bacterium]|nr:BamA/TamA family outer membrane protein [Candidatus Omnitrophota bacterium]
MKSTQCIFLWLFLVIVNLCCGDLLFAQTSLGDRREEVQRDISTQTDLLQEEKIAIAGREGAPVIEEKKAPEVTAEEGPTFFVKKIVIEGNTLLTSEELLTYAAPFEGRELSFRELKAFADLVSAEYLRNGYTTSRAYIPPQKITDGTVIVQVLEGIVGTIEVTGNRWFREQVYRDALSFDTGNFLEIADLENALREINTSPDRSVRAYLEPGTETGTTDVTLKAKDNFPLHASLEYNRRGTKLTHRSRYLLRLTDNNVFGFGDRLNTAFSFAEQSALLGGSFSYEFPWQKTGTLYRFDASVARTRLQKEMRARGVNGEPFNLGFGVTQKLLETRHVKLDGAFGLEYKDSKTTVGGDKLSYDRSRVFVVGPRVTVNDRYGRTFGASDLHVGIPRILNGLDHHDSKASRVKSGGRFQYLTLNLARLQRLCFGATFLMQAGGQWSPYPLTALEQFYLGGMSSVRGYPESDSSGDSGYNFSTEVRVPPYFIPKTWRVVGYEDKTWRDAISLIGFIEGGRCFNLKRQEAFSLKNRTLLATGFGLRFYVTPDTNLQFSVGYPFGDESTDKDRPQIQLAARFGF